MGNRQSDENQSDESSKWRISKWRNFKVTNFKVTKVQSDECQSDEFQSNESSKWRISKWRTFKVEKVQSGESAYRTSRQCGDLTARQFRYLALKWRLLGAASIRRLLKVRILYTRLNQLIPPLYRMNALLVSQSRPSLLGLTCVFVNFFFQACI